MSTDSSTAETPATRPAPLDEVMLAMDVVDTLRHGEALVERELGADDRDQALIERLKAVYAGQGIDVTDGVLAQGVAALREDRFTYRPPEPGIGLTLAGLYVDRGLWGRRLLAGTAAVLAAWLGYQALWVWPAAREAAREGAALNAEARDSALEIEASAARASRLEATLAAAPAGAPASAGGTIAAKRREAGEAIAAARRLLESARGLAPPAELSATTLEAGGETVRGQLARQRQTTSEANAALDRAQAALDDAGALAGLPEAIDAAYHSALALAQEDPARDLASRHREAAGAALSAGDVRGARLALANLDGLRKTLSEEYELRVVSRPGERSGVWRIPDRNPSARNHYLIVEAVTPGGARLRIAVTSEEDGKTEVVSQWGMRVSESLYQRVAADKADDGIIQDNRFGLKRAGRLEPEYLMPTTGGAITRW